MQDNQYLLDTHLLIWFQEGNSKISKKVLDIIENENNIILFSQVNLFEISIKKKIGKLPLLYASLEEIYQDAINDNFSFLSIKNSHIYEYNNVPLFEQHRDPFDRLLIATAISEKATILSDDNKFKMYSDIVPVLW